MNQHTTAFTRNTQTPISEVGNWRSPTAYAGCPHDEADRHKDIVVRAAQEVSKLRELIDQRMNRLKVLGKTSARHASVVECNQDGFTNEISSAQTDLHDTLDDLMDNTFSVLEREAKEAGWGS